jgi:RNA polymerase sigma-70 factor (ECF subfamily)
MSSRTTTDVALLSRLHDPNDLQAWEEFEAIYRTKVRAACLRERLDEPTADGLTGAILLQLREQMPKFQYDRERGRFRGWLDKLVRNAVQSFLRPDIPKVQERPRGGADHGEAIEQLPDPYASDPNAISDSVVQELHQDARLRRLMLFREALERVKQRLRQPKRWAAFWEVKAVGRPATEVAAELKKTRAAVSVAAGELERMLRRELESRLNRLLADAAGGKASEELAHYAGRTVDQLRQEGVRIMGPLRGELDTLLQGLAGVAAEGKSTSATARELNMPVGDCAAAANLLGDLVEAEVDGLDSEESEGTAESRP